MPLSRQTVEPQPFLSYPCPCRRQAKLVPIILTDAFGCDRCPHMFVMEEEGRLVEQLTLGYPYPRAWRWTGEAWRLIRPQQDHWFWLLMWALALALTTWVLLALPALRALAGLALLGLAWGLIVLIKTGLGPGRQ
jgi:hypothetical protein